MVEQGISKELPTLEAIDLIGVRFDGSGALPGKQPLLRHCGKLAWQRPCRSAPA